MTKRSIRDLHSPKQVQPRFCDVVIDDKIIYLEKKNKKGEYERIRWEDVVQQVNIAKETDQ